MAMQPASTTQTFLSSLGDFRWLRGHVSVYAVGVVLLVSANLVIGGAQIWSLTAVGIWSMFLFIHAILLAIARLTNELLADDDGEEIVLLPVRDAVIVDPSPKPDPTVTWEHVQPAENTEDVKAEPAETVSWQVATDAAQAKRSSTQVPEEKS